MTVVPDRYGYCVKCHKSLMTKKVVNGEVKMVFLPERTESTVILDDGSKMRVCICKSCKVNLKDSDFRGIMDSVIEGWKEEVRNINWPEKKKREYLKRYSKRRIIAKADDLDKENIKKVGNEYKERNKPKRKVKKVKDGNHK